MFCVSIIHNMETQNSIKISQFHKISKETEIEIIEYLKTLDEKELKGYNIALDHLGSSFQIEKSNGFIQWKKDKNVEK